MYFLFKIINILYFQILRLQKLWSPVNLRRWGQLKRTSSLTFFLSLYSLLVNRFLPKQKVRGMRRLLVLMLTRTPNSVTEKQTALLLGRRDEPNSQPNVFTIGFRTEGSKFKKSRDQSSAPETGKRVMRKKRIRIPLVRHRDLPPPLPKPCH